MARLVLLSLFLFFGLFTLKLYETVHGETDFHRYRYRFFDEDTSKKKRYNRPPDSPSDAVTREADPSVVLPNPSNVEVTFELSEDGKGYYVYEKVGGKDVRPPSYITREEFEQYHKEKSIRDYFRSKSDQSTSRKSDNQGFNGLVPKINVNSSLFNDIFGSGVVDIKPNGSVLLDFSYRVNRMLNPQLTTRQQRVGTFNFDQQIQLNVVGKIGEKLKLNANWDTKSQFNFENQFKIGYNGMEDDIVKGVEAGNVSLPLKGSLIQGGNNLFGVKIGMQFGPLWVTTIASQQKGKLSRVTSKGGAQQTPFEKKSAEYDENRHFFLNHYFRSLYENAMSNLPVISTPVNVTRVEVWVTNRSNSSNMNNRNAVGFVDIGENVTANGGVFFNPTVQAAANGNFPFNDANGIYAGLIADPAARERNTAVTAIQAQTFVNGNDFELIENMKRLNESEYTFHPQLGFVTLNSKLQQNDVLFVAYEYTLAGSNQVFKVGEFSIDQPSNPNNSNVLFLKMLKPSAVRPVLNDKPYPTWDLMMKNIYNIGGYNLQPDNFQLQIVYESFDGQGDINYLPSSSLKDVPLIQVFNVDRLRNNNELGSDNRFDFIPNLTVVQNKGLIMFPVLEPFGDYLANKFTGTTAPQDINKYAYKELYRKTQVDAVQFFPQFNRFKFKGSYQGSTSSEIMLNAVQISPGSIKVTAGGILLQEGADYSVDYQVGKVTILNQGILTSGQEIEVTFEQNTLFGIDQKTLVGARFDYKASKDIELGATILHLNERPLINKINMGDEPISNVIWGIDGSIKKDSRFLTTLIDKLPIINTKEISTIALNGEFAQLIPGHPRQIQNSEEKGIAYLDDFEGTRSIVDLLSDLDWKLSSHPTSVPEINDTSLLKSGFNRAKLAWYRIDPTYYDDPKDYGFDEQSPTLNNPYSRRVTPNEVFVNLTTAAGSNLLRTFDIRYFPDTRGHYNYDASPLRWSNTGKMLNPRASWGGIMRRTSGNTDFEAANFEFIEFWLMDPFLLKPNHTGGEMYLNLGKISEDVLPDNRRSYENGLARGPESKTAWGFVPDLSVSNNAFDNQIERTKQDIGLDGLNDENERTNFESFLNVATTTFTGGGLAEIQADPSSDNYAFHREDYPSGTDLLERYLKYNGPEGNSPVNQPGDKITRAQTVIPDVEDINLDGTLSSTEQYYEYKIDLSPANMVVGKNFIVDKIESEVELPNKTKTTAVWYQFRVPIRKGTAVNGIQNFKAIDFIRMYLTNFDEEIILRMAKMQLVATQWRAYTGFLGGTGLVINPEPDPDEQSLEIATVNIEENAGRKPINYVMPPRILRQGQPGAQQGILQNEQSLVLKVCDLKDGDARAAFKNVSFDMRNYKNLKMWIHAEANDANGASNVVSCGDLNSFIRVGTDYVNNYYEYEMPICPTPVGSTDANVVWANEMNFSLADLNLAKQERNDLVNAGQWSYTEPYTKILENGHRITIIGNPQLSGVKNIMIGVRNPKDDGLPVCAEIWANELRATDFDEFSGYAANARLNIKLADLANITISGSRSTPGFGGIDRKLNERSREDLKRYDLAANIQLNKFLPKKLNLEIPMYVTYGEKIIDPQYNPFDPDIKTITTLEAQKSQERKDDIEGAIRDYTLNRSISFTNVRKLKSPTKTKSYPWDLSNFGLTVGFNEVYQHNSTLQIKSYKNWLGSLDYTYTLNSKPFEPFKKAKKKNLITGFNINPLPRTLSIRIDGNRLNEYQQLRNFGINKSEIAPTFNQNFLVNRTYNLRWDLTKSLGITYSALNQARVDEPYGLTDTQEKKDTLWDNLFSIGKDPEQNKYKTINFGRTTSFNQTANVTYKLPFNLVKPLNWINSSVAYNSTFQWQTAALQNKDLGNVAQNTRSIQLNNQLNLGQFYKKFKVIDKWLKPVPKKNILSKADSSRKENDDVLIGWIKLGKFLANIVFSIQSVDINYSRNQNTILPGYLPETDNFGLDFGYTDSLTGRKMNAPAWGFVFGQQPGKDPKTFLDNLGRQGVLSRDPRLATKFMYNDNQQINARTQLQIFKGFKVNLTAQSSKSESYSELFAFDTTSSDFFHSNALLNGNFSTSFMSLGTAFKNPDKLFNTFSDNRRFISRRLSEANPFASGIETNTGYFNGYNGNSQDVLIPSFLAAYGGSKANRVRLSPFMKIPLPNWDVNYNGLSDLDFMKDLFKTVTLTHAYRSNYSVAYQTNLSATDIDRNGVAENQYTVGTGLDIFNNPIELSNFYAIYNIQAMTITEAFAPLIGLNFVWKNGITTAFDFKKNRNLMFNVGALQLNEMRNSEVSVQFNWKKDKMNLPIRLFGKDMDLNNNLTLRFEFTLRNTKSSNRRLDSDVQEPTGGMLNYTIKPSIDYALSTRLTARMYYEYNSNRPVLNTSYPTRFSSFGFQFRFALN